MLGASSYGYLVVAAHALDAAGFARLGVVWVALFTVAPGLFLPLEQAIAQRVAVNGHGQAVLVRRAAALGSGLAASVTILSVAAWPWIGARLFDNDSGLFLAMLLATCALVPVHVSRGLFAGSGRFSRYGAQLAIDGGLRLAGAAALGALGVRSTVAFAAVLVAAPLIAVAASLLGGARPGSSMSLLLRSDAGRPGAQDASWLLLARGLGWMLVGTLVAQILANGATVVVKA